MPGTLKTLPELKKFQRFTGYILGARLLLESTFFTTHFSVVAQLSSLWSDVCGITFCHSNEQILSLIVCSKKSPLSCISCICLNERGYKVRYITPTLVKSMQWLEMLFQRSFGGWGWSSLTIGNDFRFLTNSPSHCCYVLSLVESV